MTKVKFLRGAMILTLAALMVTIIGSVSDTPLTLPPT